MKIIALIGLDGSGKTTQATRFVERCRGEGLDAVYDHQFRFDSTRVMRAKARIRPWLLRAQAAVCAEGTVALAPRVNGACGRRGWRGAISKLLLVPPLALVTIILGGYRTWKKLLCNRAHRLLVMDRYFFDELVRVEWKLDIRLPLRALWLRVVPRPHVVIYFDLPGESSWERMEPKDSTRDAMRRKEQVYKEWLPLILKRGDLRIVNVSGCAIEEVQRKVEQICSRAGAFVESTGITE